MNTRKAVAFLCLVAAGCGSDPILEPVEETALQVSYETPLVDDSALLLEVTGPDVLSITLVDTENLMFSELSDDRTTRLVIFGPMQPGPLLRVVVAGESDGSEYDAVLLQVADTGNVLRNGLAGHSLVVSMIP